MKVSKIALCSSALMFALVSNSYLMAQNSASNTDKAFVSKVSQGGRYEVEASRLALAKANAQNVKDLANTEVHDHELVGKKLKDISVSEHVPIAPTLNSEFQGRLNQLKGLSGDAFDKAYMDEMSAIHDKDEKLFAQEAIDSSGDYKVFAGETDLIVKRHIGAIHGADPQ